MVSVCVLHVFWVLGGFISHFACFTEPVNPNVFTGEIKDIVVYNPIMLFTGFGSSSIWGKL